MWRSKCLNEARENLFLSEFCFQPQLASSSGTLFPRRGKVTAAPHPRQTSVALQRKRTYCISSCNISSLSPRKGSHWPSVCHMPIGQSIAKTKYKNTVPGLGLGILTYIWLRAWSSKTRCPGFKSHFLYILDVHSVNHFLICKMEV